MADRLVPVLPDIPRDLYRTQLGDWLSRVKQAFEALTDEGGILEGGAGPGGAYWFLSGNNTATGDNLLAGNTTLQGGLTMPANPAADRALNCTGARFLGRIDVDGDTIDASPLFDQLGVCWNSLGFPAYAVADGADPDDAVYLGLYSGMAVYVDPATTNVGAEDTVSTAYRCTTSRLSHPPAGLWVGDLAVMGAQRGAVICKGLIQSPDWAEVTSDASSSLTPGAFYFVADGTGDSAGKLTLTPGPWCIGQAVTDQVLWVDVPEHWGVSGIVWARNGVDPIAAGQPVTISNNLWTLACADDHATAAQWFALRDAVADAWVPFARVAELVRDDWTDVTGTADLVPDAIYWLDQNTPGLITDSPPSIEGGTTIAQTLGLALDERTLRALVGPVVRTGSAGVTRPLAFDPGADGHLRRLVSGGTELVPTDNLGSGTADATTFLRGDGTWQVVAGALALDDLSDVTITAPATGEYLRKSAGNWVNSTIQAADLPTNIDATKIGAGGVTSTEFGYLASVTSDIQTQINGKANTSHTHAASDVTSGQLAVARGGTGANLSATGGTSQVLKQVTAGANITVGTIALSDLASGTLAVALNLPSSVAVTAGNRQLTGTALGVECNTPTGTGHYWRINNTEHLRVENSTSTGIRVSGGLPLSFASNGTVVAIRAVIGLNDGLALLAASGGSHTLYVNTFLEYTFSASAFTLADANNIAVGTSTGTKIGTATTQKMGLWNVTPIVQPAAAGQAAYTDSTGGTPAASLVSVDTAGVADIAKINDNFATISLLLLAMRTAMVNFGSMKGAA